MVPFRVLAPVRFRGCWCVAAIVVGALLLGHPAGASAADPWLFVNDVHIQPSSHNPEPSELGDDTNPALLTSALAEMRRVAPNPPVIIMAGDFLGHSFKAANAIPTMTALAHRFNAVFPHAQFVIAMGNEDAECGDYQIQPNSAFLRAVATAWAPLVNRNGAAPDFVRTFPRDGFYTARLPIAGVRAIVADDTYWSPFYQNACGRGDPTPGALAELERALAPSTTQRRWFVAHIPPGIDVSSTLHRTRRLAIVPFLRPDPRDRLLQLMSDPAHRIELVVTAHVHRFAYRIIHPTGSSPIPILISPAVSPIYDNNPSFLTAEVARDGRILSLEEHSRVRGTWRDVGGLGTLGMREFSGPALVDLQHRLSRDPALRERFSMLYLGGTRWREINEDNWRSYWCAATELNATAYRDCVDSGGFSFLTGRGVKVVGAALAAVLGAVAAVALLIVVVVRRLRRLRTSR